MIFFDAIYTTHGKGALKGNAEWRQNYKWTILDVQLHPGVEEGPFIELS
jgi:hypothetical protein